MPWGLWGAAVLVQCARNVMLIYRLTRMHFDQLWRQFADCSCNFTVEPSRLARLDTRTCNLECTRPRRRFEACPSKKFWRNNFSSHHVGVQVSRLKGREGNRIHYIALPQPFMVQTTCHCDRLISRGFDPPFPTKGPGGPRRKQPPPQK